MIFITLGDPLSINIECLAKLFANKKLYEKLKNNYRTILIGSYTIWEHQRILIENCPKIKKISSPSELKNTGLFFYDLDNKIKPQRELTKDYRAVIAKQALFSLKLFKLSQNSAILSCPLDKHLVFGNDPNPAGQTEFFEKLNGKKALMMMASPHFKVGLVTNHMALSDIPKKVSTTMVKEKLLLFCRYLQNLLKDKTPKIAVCAMNPHCGDQGLFGSEDQTIIEPAVKQVLHEKNGILCKVYGPLPADTLFWQAKKGHYDGVLAIYHDQGLAPVKALEFERTVNVSVGLDFLRVSPAHGPATDLFMQGKAETGAFTEAFNIIFHYLKKV